MTFRKTVTKETIFWGRPLGRRGFNPLVWWRSDTKQTGVQRVEPFGKVDQQRSFGITCYTIGGFDTINL